MNHVICVTENNTKGFYKSEIQVCVVEPEVYNLF